MRRSTLDTIDGAGCRKLKNRFEHLYVIVATQHIPERAYSGKTYPAASVSVSPITHIRGVIAGISGSSIFDTDARTSGYGLSSSSSPSKSNSILG